MISNGIGIRVKIASKQLCSENASEAMEKGSNADRNRNRHSTKLGFQFIIPLSMPHKPLFNSIPKSHFPPLFSFYLFYFFFPQEKWKRLGNGEIKWKSLRGVDEGWVRKSKLERTPVRLNSIQACLVAPEETTSFSSLALTNPAPPQV